MSVGAVNKQTGDRIPTAGMPAVDSVLSGSSTNPVQNRVVKEALDGKQDALTFDDTPTDNSNNPVKSNGIYDALATKADTDMVAADFNAGTSYTAGNYCVQDGKLYKFKNNHSGAWSAADVDEVKITGELSSLKSGLTSLANNVSLHDIGFGDYDFDDLTAESNVTWFTNWTDSTNFPAIYGSGVLLPGKDHTQKAIFYILIGDGTARVYTNVYMNNAWGTWKQLQFTS